MTNYIAKLPMSSFYGIIDAYIISAIDAIDLLDSLDAHLHH